jgi:hypothetical protein
LDVRGRFSASAIRIAAAKTTNSCSRRLSSLDRSANQRASAAGARTDTRFSMSARSPGLLLEALRPLWMSV